MPSVMIAIPLALGSNPSMWPQLIYNNEQQLESNTGKPNNNLYKLRNVNKLGKVLAFEMSNDLAVLVRGGGQVVTLSGEFVISSNVCWISNPMAARGSWKSSNT